jgi:hypothetical protein
MVALIHGSLIVSDLHRQQARLRSISVPPRRPIL